MNLLKLIGATAVSALVMAQAQAQTLYNTLPSQNIPQVQSVGPNDLIQDIPNGFPVVPSVFASTPMLSGYFGNAGAALGDNFLIGGDFSTNLFQRGTGTLAGGLGSTVVYTADRWATWQALAGSTAFSASQSTTAASLPTGVKDSLFMRLNNSQTGTAQICVAQEIASQNAYYLAGHTVELDFNAYAGATWTASQVNAYIITGTDSGGDNGTANLAFGLNANSVSSTAWAGQANATTGAFPMSVSTMYRAMAVANIPAAATEVAVALCWTPSGTSSGTGGTDGVYFSNVELRKADYLANWVNTTTAYSVNTTSNQVQATINGTVQNYVLPPFTHRDRTLEAMLQYSYFYELTEPAASGPVGSGVYYTATECEVTMPFPVTMRAIPTVSFGGTALSASTFAVVNSVGGATPAALATDYLAAGLGTVYSTTLAGSLEATTATVTTAGLACQLVGAGGGANIQWSAEL